MVHHSPLPELLMTFFILGAIFGAAKAAAGAERQSRLIYTRIRYKENTNQ